MEWTFAAIVVAFIFLLFFKPKGTANSAISADRRHPDNSSEYFSLNIVGESYYQPAIKKCRPGDAVELRPEPENPYDENAIAVIARGKKIGHIAADRTDWIHGALRRGAFSKVQIEHITGGGSGQSLGVVLGITRDQ